jgi:hypothetical protein
LQEQSACLEQVTRLKETILQGPSSLGVADANAIVMLSQAEAWLSSLVDAEQAEN